MFSSIFLFIALVMGVIVLFAVINTMTMNVMERTNEIGTIRAMGVRRGGIRRQFTGRGRADRGHRRDRRRSLALAIAALVNHAGLTWMPPGNATAVPLRLDVAGRAAAGRRRLARARGRSRRSRRSFRPTARPGWPWSMP